MEYFLIFPGTILCTGITLFYLCGLSSQELERFSGDIQIGTINKQTNTYSLIERTANMHTKIDGFGNCNMCDRHKYYSHHFYFLFFCDNSEFFVMLNYTNMYFFITWKTFL